MPDLPLALALLREHQQMSKLWSAAYRLFSGAEEPGRLRGLGAVVTMVSASLTYTPPSRQ